MLRILESIRIRWYNLRSRVRSYYWRKAIEYAGGNVGSGFLVQEGAFFSVGEGAEIEIGKGVILAEGAGIFVGPKAKLTLGDQVFVGRRSVIAANLRVCIGAGTQIAHNVTLIDTDHVRSGPGLDQRSQLSRPITVGKEVWIAANSIILKGREIGDHATVGAGSVVTHDVPQGVTVGGNPARALSSNKSGPSS